MRNAIILAAGTSSRFVPLSAECPKGLLTVKGEVMIERQIRQLKNAGVDDITVVTGYMADAFEYLKDMFGVDIVFNEDFERYNNSSSLVRVLDRLSDTFICSSDNYFSRNVFLDEAFGSYYSALYASGPTDEYCIETDREGNIIKVNVGGHDSWYMIGHVFFSSNFSEKFSRLLLKEYSDEDTRRGYWEDVYIRHIEDLPPIKINRYASSEINEFDTLDELRLFDNSYVADTRSRIVGEIAEAMGCAQSQLSSFRKEKNESGSLQFTFRMDDIAFRYNSFDKSIIRL